MSFFEDFKKFALKGNVIDLAVGVVIGGAFQKIVSGLVSNLIMPLVGLVLPEGDWRSASIVLRENAADPAKSLKLTYGELMGNVLDFLVVALILFIVVARLLPMFQRHKEEEAAKEQAPAPPPPDTKDQVLLREIRDLLKAKE